MAITLPTFTITDPDKEARLRAAFDMNPDLTIAEEFKRWYADALIKEVQRREAALITIQAGQQIEQKKATAETLLDGAT